MNSRSVAGPLTPRPTPNLPVPEVVALLSSTLSFPSALLSKEMSWSPNSKASASIAYDTTETRWPAYPRAVARNCSRWTVVRFRGAIIARNRKLSRSIVAVRSSASDAFSLACAASFRASPASLLETATMPLLSVRRSPCGADAITSTYNSPATPTVTMTAPSRGSQLINLPNGDWSSLKNSQSYKYSYNSPSATSAVQAASHASYMSMRLSNAAWITSSSNAEREGGIRDLARARLLYFCVILIAVGLRVTAAVISWLTRNRKPEDSIRLRINED